MLTSNWHCKNWQMSQSGNHSSQVSCTSSSCDYNLKASFMGSGSKFVKTFWSAMGTDYLNLETHA
jgi:hypothetical protein